MFQNIDYLFFYRQLKNLRREKEEAEAKMEEAKATSKRLVAENNKLHADWVAKEQKNASTVDKLKQDIASQKQEIALLKGKAVQEKSLTIQSEAKSYLEFVMFMNEHLLLESEELPKLIDNLSNRAVKNFGGAMKIPNKPDYNKLLLEIVNQSTPTPSVS